MKRVFLSILLTSYLMVSYAGVTTYQFVSAAWASKVDATPCDGQTDGWISDQDASEYIVGRTDAMGQLYSQGVSVKTGTSGAGATSVRSFTDVRRISFNFCQNSSRGRGTIYVQVGEGPVDSIVVTKPATSGSGVWMRDSVVVLNEPRSGAIRFYVTCSENAININSITIRSADGGTSPFTTASYRLVTDASNLCDGDQIILGVHQSGVNYIMGYFDEEVSKNNIHAIKGHYSADRQVVEEDYSAVYTLHHGQTRSGEDAWYIEDELRYEDAYLVASGGQTKNRLALWDRLVDENTYGDYGYWQISVTTDGKAQIVNMGNSLGRYLQYNAQNSPTLFACYAAESQTPVSIYRRVEALGDVEAIVVPMVNFGEVLMSSPVALEGQQTILVNANRLTEDIHVRLADGQYFAVSDTLLDRDGDYLTIHYQVTDADSYADTLILTSGEVEERVLILLNLLAPMTIEQATESEDFTSIYLNDVIVTKKFDTYIFVRDETGSMLIYDNGDGTGHRYGSGLKSGDVLHNVRGKYRNYFGVPELAPSESWSLQPSTTCLPEIVTHIDSADVCHYVRLDSVVVENSHCVIGGQSYEVVDAFDTGLMTGVPTSMDAIVYISWNAIQLWVVAQRALPTALPQTPECVNATRYNVLGIPVDADYHGVVITPSGKRLQ